MVFPPNPNNAPLGTAAMATTPMARPKKSGCGCCGCMFGCLFIIVAMLGSLVGAYFFLDFGPIIERQLYSSYKGQIRPLIEQKLALKMGPAERQQTMAGLDFVLDEYMKLPEDEKKPLRKEIKLYLWYEIEGQKVPPEKVPHLLQFQKQVEPELQQRFHLPIPPPDGNPNSLSIPGKSLSTPGQKSLFN